MVITMNQIIPLNKEKNKKECNNCKYKKGYFCTLNGTYYLLSDIIFCTDFEQKK